MGKVYFQQLCGSFVDVEGVECIHGYFEYAPVMSSQFVPKKLMAWSICTLLHGFSGSIQGWFEALAGSICFSVPLWH